MAIAHKSLVALKAHGLYKIGVGDLVGIELPSERKLVKGSELHAWDIQHNGVSVGRFAVLKHAGKDVAFRLHVSEREAVYHLDSVSGLTLRSPGSSRLGGLDEQAHDSLAELFKHLGRKLLQPHQSAMASLLSFSKTRLSKNIRRQPKKP